MLNNIFSPIMFTPPPPENELDEYLKLEHLTRDSKSAKLAILGFFNRKSEEYIKTYYPEYYKLLSKDSLGHLIRGKYDNSYRWEALAKESGIGREMLDKLRLERHRTEIEARKLKNLRELNKWHQQLKKAGEKLSRVGAVVLNIAKLAENVPIKYNDLVKRQLLLDYINNESNRDCLKTGIKFLEALAAALSLTGNVLAVGGATNRWTAAGDVADWVGGVLDLGQTVNSAIDGDIVGLVDDGQQTTSDIAAVDNVNSKIKNKKARKVMLGWGIVNNIRDIGSGLISFFNALAPL